MVLDRRSLWLLSLLSVLSPRKCLSAATWYNQICTTGAIEAIARDESGDLDFVGYQFIGHGQEQGQGQGQGQEQGDQNSNMTNNTSNRLRRNLGSYEETLAIAVPASRALASDNDNENSNGTGTFAARPCLCIQSEYPKDPYYESGSDSSFEVDRQVIYLCPTSADYCGVSFYDGITVSCFSISVQQVVARNAWPLILLWYFGLIVICFCTIHGHTAKEYFTSCFYKEHDHQLVTRMLQETPRPPSSRWNWWGWQRYRFQETLLASSTWIWRQEEYLRHQHEVEQGLHAPPQMEMKTKRFVPNLDPDEDVPANQKIDVVDENENRVENGNGDDNGDDSSPPTKNPQEEDNNSLHEPTCTICFVPLEEGDRIGALECQHDFHVECLKSWISRRNACPLCAQPIATRRNPPGQQEPEQS